MINLFLPGKFHGQRSLVGYNPWGPKELDTTKQLKTQRKKERKRGIKRDMESGAIL